MFRCKWIEVRILQRTLEFGIRREQRENQMGNAMQGQRRSRWNWLKTTLRRLYLHPGVKNKTMSPRRGVLVTPHSWCFRQEKLGAVSSCTFLGRERWGWDVFKTNSSSQELLRKKQCWFGFSVGPYRSFEGFRLLFEILAPSLSSACLSFPPRFSKWQVKWWIWQKKPDTVESEAWHSFPANHNINET